MSVRSQIAKLKQQTGSAQYNNDVRNISDLMDELSAAAAGGGGVRGEVSLLEILGEAPDQHWPNQSQHNQKVTQ
ncbi:hypothetical protein [Pseudomonas sp.]|uniref:hypothetical protein n=1 Tax=Pseudomonas sp. TaxID=306 RepID=UPI003F2F6BFC